MTFVFKQQCAATDGNCLDVPASRFDVTIRYYLPREPIITGRWTFPAIAPKMRSTGVAIVGDVKREPCSAC